MLEAHSHSAPAASDKSLEALFRRIARIPKLHARFLNTIAMLEYIGARKIMKSQEDVEFDLELLSHVAEESKHAWLVKRLATRVDAEAAATYGPDHLLCKQEAEGYMQAIDSAAEAALKDVDTAGMGCSKTWAASWRRNAAIRRWLSDGRTLCAATRPGRRIARPPRRPGSGSMRRR